MTNRSRLAVAALAMLTAAIDAPAWAEDPASFTVVETGHGYASLQDAIDAIGSGQGSIAIAPGHYRQCAVQQAGSISYLATEPGQSVFDGVACEGKAALVLRGRSADVSGLVFENIAVPDFNGAGIRLESGNLIVAQSWFRDSQEGILTANDPQASILIDHSTFSRLGTCEGGGGCAHSVYVGNYGLLRITNSRFEQGRGGHYVKSRAAQVQIAGCSFDDSNGQHTNYMIDLPNGASGQISNNWFVQGPNKDNHSAFIAVAAEGKTRSSADLAILANTARFAPGVSWPSVFVADWSGEVTKISDNRLAEGLTRYQRR